MTTNLLPVLGAFAFLIVAALAAWLPRGALFVFVFLLMAFNDYLGGLPTSIFSLGGKLFYGADAFLILFLVGIWRGMLRRNYHRRVDWGLFAVVVVLTGVGIAAVLRGLSEGYAVNRIIGDFRRWGYYPWAIFIPGLLLVGKGDRRIFERVIFLSAGVICAVATFRILTGTMYGLEPDALPEGSYRAVSYHGYVVLVLALAMAIGRFQELAAPATRTTLIVLFLVPTFVIASNYRMAWIAMFVSVGIMLASRKPWSSQPRRFIGVVVVWMMILVAGVTMGRLSGNAAYAEVERRFRGDLLDFNWGERESYRGGMWEGAIARWKRDPVMGTGFGYAYSYLDRTRGGEWFWRESQDMHNSFLEVLLKAGAVGLLGFVVFLSVIVARLIRMLRTQEDERAVAAGGIAFIVTVLLTSAVQPVLSMPNSAVLTYLVVGIFMAMGVNGAGRVGDGGHEIGRPPHRIVSLTRPP